MPVKLCHAASTRTPGGAARGKQAENEKLSIKAFCGRLRLKRGPAPPPDPPLLCAPPVRLPQPHEARRGPGTPASQRTRRRTAAGHPPPLRRSPGPPSPRWSRRPSPRPSPSRRTPPPSTAGARRHGPRPRHPSSCMHTRARRLAAARLASAPFPSGTQHTASLWHSLPLRFVLFCLNGSE